MKTWQQLLDVEWDGIGLDYGPHSQQVWSAIEVLGQAPWFQHVGAATGSRDVEQVASWEQALAIVQRPQEYDEKGFPPHVVAEVWPTTTDLTLGAWWRSARAKAEDYYDYSVYIPTSLSEWQRDFVWEHLYTFISLLLAEIIGADRVRSTYAREAVAWYAAGRFPCGRDPSGRWRIY